MLHFLCARELVPIDKIAIPSDLCRVHVARDDALVQTIKSFGIIQPLTVRPSGEGYELVCGYRRLMHAREAGLTVVPCVVKEMSDVEAAETTLIENLERMDLTDYEKGRWLKLLMERFPDKYPSHQALADKFGLSKRMVSFLISHYEFIEKIKDRLPPNMGTRVPMLPEGFTRQVMRAPEEIQPKILVAPVKMLARHERGEEEHPPSVRDVATLVDSYIKKWEQPAEEKVEATQPSAPSTGPKPATPAKPSAPPSAPKPQPRPQPVLPTKPTPPSEEELEKELTEIVKKRWEAKLRRDEKVVVTLYKYYPESFLRDLESFCGTGSSVEDLQKLAYYTIEVAWDRTDNEEKQAFIREARSWMD